MNAETKAVALLIRIMPLMRREFAHGIDSKVFFSDMAYANSVLEEACQAKDERIVRYARELRYHLSEMTQGTVGSVRANIRSVDLPVLDDEVVVPSNGTGHAAGTAAESAPRPQRYLRTLR